jgi:hypothetical protein
MCRFQCLRDLMCGSAAVCLLGMRARFLLSAWVSVPCGYCLLSEACPMDRSFAQGSPTDFSVYKSDFET